VVWGEEEMSDFFREFSDDNLFELFLHLTGKDFGRLESCSKELHNRLKAKAKAFYKFRCSKYLWLLGEGWNTTQWVRHYTHLCLEKYAPRMIIIGGSSNRNNNNVEQWLRSCEDISSLTTSSSSSLKPFKTRHAESTLPTQMMTGQLSDMNVPRNACAVSRNPETHALFVSGGWDGKSCHTSIEYMLPTSNKWKLSADQLLEPRCFHAAVYDRVHEHLIMGGSSHLFQGAIVSQTMEKHSLKEKISPVVITNMLHKRAGHVASLNPLTKNIVVCGGYGGGSIYHNTVERMVLNGESTGFQKLPSMSTKKTGSGGGHGPYGYMYICGGSTNGGDGLKIVERLDLRMKKWETIAPLNCGRGYCSASWSADGRLYCMGGSILKPTEMLHGGQIHVVDMQQTYDTIEMFDPRYGKSWIVMNEPLKIQRADLCCTIRLTTSNVVVESLLKRENPVIDWWQSRRMRTRNF
jgi:hypothetical protein